MNLKKMVILFRGSIFLLDLSVNNLEKAIERILAGRKNFQQGDHFPGCTPSLPVVPMW
jgi:hypothetical protein